MTLHTILNRCVRAADGRKVGHVYDFTAKRIGHDIRITHLHVGAAAWLDRLGLGHALHRVRGRSAGYEIPWEAIESIGHEVRLRAGWDTARCKLHPLGDQGE
jgi:hypothetical protein